MNRLFVFFILILFASQSKAVESSLNIIDLETSEDECFQVVEQTLEVYHSKYFVLIERPVITIDGKYRFAINCIEESKVVHIFSDKVRDEKYNEILKRIIDEYKKVSKEPIEKELRN